jgi:serine/threonine protein kinase
MSTSQVSNPALQLEGVVLEGGWTVGALIQRPPQSTGGTFCQCYSVRSATGKPAFLKALDFLSAFERDTDFIERITVLFNFERDLLRECGERNMDRVVKAIASGTLRADPTNPFTFVPYLIFEAADSDIRLHLDNSKTKSSIAFKLRAIHHVATGLKQLHGAEIAHQDLKPSNVLVFYVDRMLAVSKIADLGRASRSGHASPYDEEPFAGDRNYAPPEILYSHIDPDWAKRRIAGDLYMLGGLISFIFCQTTSIASLLRALPTEFWPGNWGGTYEDVLPYLVNSFSETVDMFASDLPPKLRDDLVPAFQRLCHPDPSRRTLAGAPLNKISLERYLSNFDLLASRAEAGKYD